VVLPVLIRRAASVASHGRIGLLPVKISSGDRPVRRVGIDRRTPEGMHGS
jgi:hypothetical protein